jgi:hypothetical protein
MAVVAGLAMLAPAPGVQAEDSTPPRLVEVVSVSSQDPSGTDVPTTLKGNTTYVFLTSGRYRYGPGGFADVECSEGPDDPQFRRDRYGPTTLDLLVNGKAFDWQPLDPDSNGCSPSNMFRLVLPVAQDTSVNLRIDDIWHGDNLGSVTVMIFRVCGLARPANCEDEVDVPVPSHPYPAPKSLKTVIVDTADPKGTTTSTPLIAGRTYDLYVTGRFTHRRAPTWVPLVLDYKADAECSEGPNHRWSASSPYSYSLDLELNGVAPDWKPVTAWAECDPASTYRLTLTPDTSGPLTARIDDIDHKNNEGHLVLVISER